jgi:hypothetical protein
LSLSETATKEPTMRVAYRLIALAFLTLTWATPARAVDGFALGIHFELAQGKFGNIHDSSRPGTLVRYEIKGDQVVGKKVLDDKPEVMSACISPFGDRIAIVKASGMIAVMPADGGAATDLVSFIGDEKPGNELVATYLQWPASDGGNWIYYLDGRKNGANNTLRRVNVATRQDEVVVVFNRSANGGFALSMDATPRQGHLIKRTDNYVIAIYDLAKGDGDLYACPRTSGCGESISPDGSLLTANNGWHNGVGLIDMNGRQQQAFRISEWGDDPCKPSLNLPREKVEWAWQAFRWSVNAMNWISVTQGKIHLGTTHETFFQDLMLYDWVAKKQINVTNNPAGAFDRTCGFWQATGNEVFLGYFGGKAPLTVAFADGRVQGDWAWDFGDGSPAAKGAAPQHVFAKEGAFTVAAKLGDRSLRAQVTVQPQRAPKAACAYVSDTCLLVDFDEPVKAADAKATLDNGPKIAELSLNETGRRMQVILADPLKGADVLHLAGVTDFAQVPNALDPAPIPVAIPAWPSNRKDLHYVWEDGKKLNAVFNPATKRIREFRLNIGLDRFGRMQLDGGRAETGFFSQVNAQMDFRDLVLADAFSLEVTIQPTNLTQSKPEFPARIVNCSAWHDGDWEFMLGQQADKLLFSVRTTDNMLSLDGKKIANDLHGRAPVYQLATLPDTKPHHVIVSYVPGKLVAYLDGKQCFASTEVTGSLKAWGYGELCFGDNHNGGRHAWLGRLEGVAIYKRFIEADEAKANCDLYAKKLAARHVMPQVEIEAVLLATSEIPEAKKIAPYTEALVVNEYQVKTLVQAAADWPLKGVADAGKKIRVAQWGLIDAKPTDLAKAKVGETYRLALEVFDHHPDKLDDVVMSNNLPVDVDVPMLYQPRR